MKELPVEPQIEVESAAEELRITVPQTARVTSYYKCTIALRSASAIVLIGIGAAMGVTRVRDLGWDAMWGTFVLVFAGALFYSLRYPDRVNLFTASTAIVCLDDTTLSVTDSERQRTRRYARNQISAIRTQRCDFSRCGIIVISGKRDGHRFKSIIAVYAELQPLSDIAEMLRRAIGLKEEL